MRPYSDTLYAASILSRRMAIELPTALEVIILIFIFAAEILGEIQDFM